MSSGCLKTFRNMALSSCGKFLFSTLNPIRIHSLRTISLTSCVESNRVPDSAIPKPAGLEKYGAINQDENGVIYDKKPYKITLEKGKWYSWCLCGKSKSQPLCDGTHKLVCLKIKQRPIKFQVEETKEYWLCNCKQTTHRPFCDGTHLREDIQAAIR